VTTPDDISIGDRVRFYRQGSGGKSQAVVSGLAGITENYLSQIERGLKTPTIGVLQRLAAVLGVSVSVLLGEPSYASESAIHPIAPAIQAALMTRDEPQAEPAEARDAPNPRERRVANLAGNSQPLFRHRVAVAAANQGRAARRTCHARALVGAQRAPANRRRPLLPPTDCMQAHRPPRPGVARCRSRRVRRGGRRRPRACPRCRMEPGPDSPIPGPSRGSSECFGPIR